MLASYFYSINWTIKQCLTFEATSNFSETPTLVNIRSVILSAFRRAWKNKQRESVINLQTKIILIRWEIGRKIKNENILFISPPATSPAIWRKPPEKLTQFKPIKTPIGKCCAGKFIGHFAKLPIPLLSLRLEALLSESYNFFLSMLLLLINNKWRWMWTHKRTIE